MMIQVYNIRDVLYITAHAYNLDKKNLHWYRPHEVGNSDAVPVLSCLQLLIAHSDNLNKNMTSSVNSFMRCCAYYVACF